VGDVLRGRPGWPYGGERPRQGVAFRSESFDSRADTGEIGFRAGQISGDPF
jgi:hypothetical protein